MRALHGHPQLAGGGRAKKQAVRTMRRRATRWATLAVRLQHSLHLPLTACPGPPWTEPLPKPHPGKPAADLFSHGANTGTCVWRDAATRPLFKTLRCCHHVPSDGQSMADAASSRATATVNVLGSDLTCAVALAVWPAILPALPWQTAKNVDTRALCGPTVAATGGWG